MRVSKGQEVYLLDRHLQRLRRSAQFFSFQCDVGRIRDEILQAAAQSGGAACLRLTLANDGTSHLETGPLPSGYARQLKVSTVRVNSSDVFLYHKTTNRGVYEAARRECDAETDVILINERGEITET